MSAELYAVFGAPILGAMLLLALPEGTSPRTHRFIAGGALLACLGGAARALLRVVDAGPYSSRSFTVDEWRAGLVLGAVAVSLACLARGSALIPRGSGPSGPDQGSHARAGALLLAASTCAPVSILASTTPVFVLGCVMTTVCLTASSWNGARAPIARILWPFAASDLAIAAGAVLAVNDGLLTPAHPGGLAAVVLAAGVLLRSGVIARPAAPQHVAAPEADAVALGVMRAQAFCVAGWITVGRGGTTVWLAIMAAALGAAWARRATRESDARSALAAHAALVVAGIAVGSPASTAGAVLLACGAALAAVVFILGRARGVLAFTVAAAPLGATLTGAVMITGSSVARGMGDGPSLAVGTLAACATCWLALAGIGGLRSIDAEPAPRIFVLPVAVLIGGFVVAPSMVARAAAVPAARALGVSATLAPLEPPIGNDLGIAMAIAALAGLIAMVPQRVVAPLPAGVAAPVLLGPTPAGARAVVVLIAASVAASLALVWVGILRGFL